MERSVYIIKPEAESHRAAIHAVLEESGLTIVARTSVLLPDWALEALYPDINKDLRGATRMYFGLGPCEVGVVEGANAIERLFTLAGTAVSPAECASSSIRARFGVHRPVRYRSAVYYLNGFHRSSDFVEAQRDLELFKSLRAAPEADRR